MTRTKTILPCCCMALCSLFMQGLHWFIYEKVGFSRGLLWLTPLILCAMYHVFQSDSRENRIYSRRMVFVGSVLVPLLAGILVSGVIFLRHPDLYLFQPSGKKAGKLTELMGLYGGRLILTSGYMLIFSVLDLFLLSLQDRYRGGKRSAEITDDDRISVKEKPTQSHSHSEHAV